MQLQTQTKDSHLNQLGEVERRFAAISRQCAMVKQAHEKLEQNGMTVITDKHRPSETFNYNNTSVYVELNLIIFCLQTLLSQLMQSIDSHC